MKLSLEQTKKLPKDMKVKGQIDLDILNYTRKSFEDVNFINVEGFFDDGIPQSVIPLEEYDYGVDIESIIEVMECLQFWGEPSLSIDRILVDYSMGAEDLILAKLIDAHANSVRPNDAIRTYAALSRLQDALYAVKEASRRLEELGTPSPLSVELLDALDEARDKCRQAQRSIERSGDGNNTKPR